MLSLAPLDLPGAQRDLLAAHRDLDPGFDAAHGGARSRGILILEHATEADHLPRVALVPQEADPGQRDSEIPRRLHVVAGEDPEAASVDRKHGIEPLLHAEVRDAWGTTTSEQPPKRDRAQPAGRPQATP
jgi:hypothetical protein